VFIYIVKCHHDLVNHYRVSTCVTNDYGYVPFVVITIRSFVTRVNRRVPHVERELLTLPEHLNSPLVFSGVRVARSFVFCVMFCRSLFVLYLLAIVLSVNLQLLITTLVSSTFLIVE
jgi:hypothetical protein